SVQEKAPDRNARPSSGMRDPRESSRVLRCARRPRRYSKVGRPLSQRAGPTARPDHEARGPQRTEARLDSVETRLRGEAPMANRLGLVTCRDDRTRRILPTLPRYSHIQYLNATCAV